MGVGDKEKSSFALIILSLKIYFDVQHFHCQVPGFFFDFLLEKNSTA